MKKLSLLLMFLCYIIIGKSYKKEQCQVIKFDFRYFEKEYLINGGLTRPFHLTYNEKNNLLMFHEDTEVYKLTKTYLLNLETKEVIQVNGLNNAMSSIVDDKGDFIVASNNGLFNYNITSNTLTPYLLEEVAIYCIYKYNGKIHYIDYPNKDVYVIENNKPKLLLGGHKIETFILDSSSNYYFGNNSGWYYGNQITKTIDYVAESDEAPFDTFILNEGNEIPFVFSHYGVFKIKRDDGTFKRISTKGMLHMVFEKNRNMIYSDEEHIVRLKPSRKIC